jgi:hypothetical protein
MKNKRKYHLDYFYEKAQDALFEPEVEAKELDECVTNIARIAHEWKKKVEYSQKRFYIGLPEYEEIAYNFQDIDTGVKVMTAIDEVLAFIKDTTKAGNDLTTAIMEMGYSFSETNKIKKTIDILTFNGLEYRIAKYFDDLEKYIIVEPFANFINELHVLYPEIYFIYRKNDALGYMY